ncbi:DUF1801 domain-containing protein [Flavobacterium sp.]|uniref:DUF1801 domain-containing protein n=1 Tax=Flavobacterium sp. TaxID=239 RepID=UPI00286E332D|nr:DUF1801 domain-containing protein [Flavobacterium sp.]
MQSDARTPDQYIAELPNDRRKVIERLRKVSRDNLPEGFKEVMGYGMMGYVVPHELYPNGYHCDPKQPLPFYGFASQKNSVNIYHMAVYADKKLYDWFVSEFPKYSKARLDMGKSCVRFKKLDDIPYDLIGKLLSKVTVEDWISMYENAFKK